MLSFTDKVKSINVQVPEKVKLYIDDVLGKEIKYFKDKFKKEHEVEVSRLIQVFNNNIWNNKKSVK